MAWTQADIDKLKGAIASGSAIQSMTIAGQQFTFRTADDMLKLLAVMEGQVNGATRNHRLAATSKGA
jgi:hypothetical protein